MEKEVEKRVKRQHKGAEKPKQPVIKPPMKSRAQTQVNPEKTTIQKDKFSVAIKKPGLNKTAQSKGQINSDILLMYINKVKEAQRERPSMGAKDGKIEEGIDKEPLKMAAIKGFDEREVPPEMDDIKGFDEGELPPEMDDIKGFDEEEVPPEMDNIKGFEAGEEPLKMDDVKGIEAGEEPLKMDDIKGFDAEELRKEIGGVEIPNQEKPPEKLLAEIQEERRRLEEERSKLKEEIKHKERMIEESEEEEEKTLPEPKAINSFAKERKKRKDLERLRRYLYAGEFGALLILMMAMLYSADISINPVYLPIENSIYLIIIFLLVVQGERYLFRFYNMKYSGTLQRKVIGVEHFMGIEFPPMIFIAFLVAVFLIPQTSDFIGVLFKILSFNGAVPISPSFVFNLAILFLVSFILSITWLMFLRWYKMHVIAPELEKITEPFIIQDVFVIANSGILLKHITREQKIFMDDDILSSMLTAVKDFVKDSFKTSEEGELDELQYGKLRIIIEYGKMVYIAAVIRGQESMQLRPMMKRTLKQIHRRFGRVLEGWDGDIAGIKGIEHNINPLINLG